VPRRFRVLVRRARDAATAALSRHHQLQQHQQQQQQPPADGTRLDSLGTAVAPGGADHLFAIFVERLLGASLRVLRRLLFVLRLLETHARLRAGEKIPLGYSRAPLKEGHKAAVRVRALLLDTCSTPFLTFSSAPIHSAFFSLPPNLPPA
jgi:hypothetical protein